MEELLEDGARTVHRGGGGKEGYYFASIVLEACCRPQLINWFCEQLLHQVGQESNSVVEGYIEKMFWDLTVTVSIASTTLLFLFFSE